MITPSDIAATQLGVQAFTITMRYKTGPIDGLMRQLRAIANSAKTPDERHEVGAAIEALMVQYRPPLTATEMAELID